MGCLNFFGRMSPFSDFNVSEPAAMRRKVKRMKIIFSARILVLTFLTLEVFSVGALAETAQTCPVFILERDQAGLRIEKFEIPEGSVQVFTSDSDSGFIDVILPPGPGGSGSLVQSDEKSLHIVRCEGESIIREVRLENGEKVDYPGRKLADLQRYNIRISVTGGDGISGSFLISGYQKVDKDHGPVQNLLSQAGYPKGEKDYVLTTDTYLRQVGESIYGRIDVELRGHPFARVERYDGKSVWFIVDIGAAESLIERDFLPDSFPIEKTSMVEYSTAGRRLLDYSPGGATGKVKGILGHAKLSRLKVGDMDFNNVSAAVIEDLPDLFDRPVSGIIGMDILRRAERLTIEFPSGADGSGRLHFKGPIDEGRINADGWFLVPFSIVNSHILVNADVNESQFYLILDTGAPKIVLDSKAAEQFRIDPQQGSESEIGGLDTNKVMAREGRIRQLILGESMYEEVGCTIAPLSAFDTLRRQGQAVGLLGNSFFGRFEQVEIDYMNRTVKFKERNG
jgi:predicted aspartyl protease